MFQKNCYTCNRPSFSSDDRGQWVCPSCGKDLSSQRAFESGGVPSFFSSLLPYLKYKNTK